MTPTEKQEWVASLVRGDEVFISRGHGLGYTNLLTGTVTDTGEKGWVRVRAETAAIFQFNPSGMDKRTSNPDTYWLYPVEEKREEAYRHQTLLKKISSFNFKRLDTDQLEVIWSVLANADG